MVSAIRVGESDWLHRGVARTGGVVDHVGPDYPGKVGANWCADGSLCIERNWEAKCSFAQQVLFAIAYLDEQL